MQETFCRFRSYTVVALHRKKYVLVCSTSSYSCKDIKFFPQKPTLTTFLWRFGILYPEILHGQENIRRFAVYERICSKYHRLHRSLLYGLRLSATGLSHHPHAGYRGHSHADISRSRCWKYVLCHPRTDSQKHTIGCHKHHHNRRQRHHYGNQNPERPTEEKRTEIDNGRTAVSIR